MVEHDFSGRLVIKAQLDEDLRRILIHNEELTYDELILMMQRVFKPKLENVENLVIKYRDEDDEYVTIAEEFDLSYAIHQYKTLRLKLFLPKQDDPMATEAVLVENSPSIDASDHHVIVKELHQLREEISCVAEKLDRLILSREHLPSVPATSSLGATGEASAVLAFEKPLTRDEAIAKPTEVPSQLEQVISKAPERQPEPSTHLPPFRPSLNQPSGFGGSSLPPPPFQPSLPPLGHLGSPTVLPPNPVVPPMECAPQPPHAPPPTLVDGSQQPPVASTPPPPTSSSIGSGALTNPPPLLPPPSSVLGGGGLLPPPSLPSQLSSASAHQPAMLPTTNLPPPNLSQQQPFTGIHPPPPTMPMKHGLQQPGRPTLPLMRPMMGGVPSGMVQPPPPMPQPGHLFPSTTAASGSFGAPPVSQPYGGGAVVPPPPPPPSFMNFGYQSVAPPQMSQPFQPGGSSATPFQPGAPPQPPPLQLGGLPPSSVGGSPYPGGPYGVARQ